MNWLDSHCHINDKAFKDDLDVVLNNMVLNDVTKAMIVSSYLDDYDYALKIKHNQLSFKHSLGIYPSDAGDFDEDTIQKYFSLFNEVDAVGEIGLDYHYGKDNRDKQIEIFKRQLEIAQKLNKPVIIHTRDAIQDTYDILSKYKLKGVIHCYSSSAQMAKNFVKLGYYISISGTITWKNAIEPLEVIHTVPLDRLLIETDCPYLTPEPNRGKRNEPSNVIYTGKRICKELMINEELFKAQINDNYHTLFDNI